MTPFEAIQDYLAARGGTDVIGWASFESGRVTIDDELVNSVLERLEEEHFCALVGGPARGKTKTACYVGYKWIQQSGRDAFYASADSLEFPEARDTMQYWGSRLGPRVLFIIDDCHKRPGAGHWLVPLKEQCKREPRRSPSIMLVSLVAAGDPQLEALLEKEDTLQVAATLRERLEIVRRCRQERLHEASPPKEEVNAIVEECGDNLLWLDKRAHAVDEADFLGSIITEYGLRSPTGRQACLPLAAINQLDVDVHVSFTDRLGCEIPQDLIARGRLQVKRGVWYSFPAAQEARLVLHAAAKARVAEQLGQTRQAIDSFTLEQLKAYVSLSCPPPNLHQLFRALYRENKGILGRLLDDDATYDALRRWTPEQGGKDPLVLVRVARRMGQFERVWEVFEPILSPEYLRRCIVREGLETFSAAHEALGATARRRTGEVLDRINTKELIALLEAETVTATHVQQLLQELRLCRIPEKPEAVMGHISTDAWKRICQGAGLKTFVLLVRELMRVSPTTAESVLGFVPAGNAARLHTGLRRCSGMEAQVILRGLISSDLAFFVSRSRPAALAGLVGWMANTIEAEVHPELTTLAEDAGQRLMNLVAGPHLDWVLDQAPLSAQSRLVRFGTRLDIQAAKRLASAIQNLDLRAVFSREKSSAVVEDLSWLIRNLGDCLPEAAARVTETAIRAEVERYFDGAPLGGISQLLYNMLWANEDAVREWLVTAETPMWAEPIERGEDEDIVGYLWTLEQILWKDAETAGRIAKNPKVRAAVARGLNCLPDPRRLFLLGVAQQLGVPDLPHLTELMQRAEVIKTVEGPLGPAELLVSLGVLVASGGISMKLDWLRWQRERAKESVDAARTRIPSSTRELLQHKSEQVFGL